jgi:hypothetical protein
MIDRKIDVKDLVNSKLFFPQVFYDHQIFSDNEKPIIEPYFCELKDLEYENPCQLFQKN